ncbi:MAG: protein kinase [Kofleriaceae bacterium]
MDALRGRFGRYHVLDKIAQGGMAEIYKVKTVGLAGFEKIQALKRILPNAAQHGRFIRSFIDEARIAVELSHRNIVQVFDFGKAEGDLYLAMELIEGQDLRAAMTNAAARGVRCPLDVAAYIISEVAAGLDHAHRKTDAAGRALGIVHCDMSPSNVMLSSDGYVKILDFGIARATFSSALERRRLRGKPRYMAPEQTRGEAPLPATDVFALGIIAWELMTGRALFGGASLRDILHDVRTHDAPDLRDEIPEIDSEVAGAIATALQRDPARRGTAADLSAACVRAALSSGPRGVVRWQDEIARGAVTFPEGIAALELPGNGAIPEEPRRPSARSFEFPDAASIVVDVGPSPRVELDEVFDVPTSADHAGPLPWDDPGAARAPAEASPAVAWPASPHAALGDADHDEVIDDHPNDFDMDAVAALLDRRRIVVVVALLDGAPRETLDTLGRTLSELAYQRGGVVLGRDDGALILAFGLEVAGEDDVDVAMTWAVDASARARDGGTEPGAPQLRVGGRAGVVSSGGPDGSLRVPPEVLEEARALARQAQPDRPLFVGGAGRLSSALFALREVAVRHGKRSRSALEVVGPRTFDERCSALLARRGKFVGRQRELAVLGMSQQRALAEHRRVIALVRGVNGVGKSRLCAEFAAFVQAQSSRTAVIVASAAPATRQAPFGLLMDFLQAALALPPERGRASRDKLAKRLRKMLRLAEVEPSVANAVLGDLERAMELRDGTAMGTSDLADLRDRVAGALIVVRRSLLVMRRRIPETERRGLTAVVVMENLHHADRVSLETMRHIFSTPEEGPEVFLLTTQDERPPWPFIEDEVELHDLVGGELRALAVDRLGDAATPLNVAAVITRAGGTPLFVEELASAAAHGGDQELPHTAHDVIAARVDRLSAEAKTLLCYAAVLGDVVRARLLEEVLGQGDIGDALEELVHDGWLERRGDVAPESPEGELSFARGLFREVAYGSLSSRARRDAHARVGRLLVARFFAGREEPPAAIAEHLEHGGEVAAAAAFWLRAGRISLSAGDAETAARHFSRCLDQEEGLGESPPNQPSRVRRREAHLGREEARRLLGDLSSDDPDLAALQRLCEGQPRRLADLANRLAQRQLRRGDHAAALAATLQAEQLARQGGDERLRAEALRLRGEVYEHQGELDSALSLVAQAGTIFRRHGYLGAEISAMVGTGRIHLLRGHYEAARDSYRPVIESIQQSGDPWLERVVRNHLAVIEMCLGNFSEAMALAQRSIDLCRRYGDRCREGDTLAVSAAILCRVGLYDDAASTFDSAIELLTRTSSRWSRADCLIAAGGCDVRRGLPVGVDKLDEAIGEARALGARYLEANGLVARADARLRLGDAAAAAQDAEAGSSVARRATLVGCEIRGLARHAMALHRLGSTDRALPLARRALGMLEVQGHLDGAEEEILQACGDVLCAAGETERGAQALGRARAGVSRKLSALAEPAWRSAYAAEHSLLLREP